MSGDGADFALRELAARGGDSAPLLDDLAFLRALNAHLAERFEHDWPARTASPPSLFMIGLPRSGTTLLMQVLCACLDVGYIDNVAARFWRAPLTGIRLSRAVLGRRRDRSWRSDHGKTPDPAGPHEFAYFWHWLLRMERMPPYDPDVDGRAIDWDLVRRVLDNVSDAFGAPTIHKAMHAGYHVARLAQALPDSLFIHVRRPLLDVAASLAAARVRYYGDLQAWWSLFTPDYEALRTAPWWRQIAAQVTWLARRQAQGLAAVDPARVVTVPYASLCAAPAAVAQDIATLLRVRTGRAVGRIGEPPAQFAPSVPAVTGEIRAQLARGLAELGTAGEGT